MATAKRKEIQQQRVEQAPAAAVAGSPLDRFFGLSARDCQIR
jgi:hypothetical protein